MTPTGTGDRERLGIGLAAVGRPAYVPAGQVTDLGAERDVATFRDRAFAVVDAAYAARIRYVDAARSYGPAEEFLAAWLAAHPGIDDVVVGSKGATATSVAGGWTPRRTRSRTTRSRRPWT